MDKVKSLIPLGILFAFSAKYLALGCNLSESLVFVCLATIYLTSEYFNHNKRIDAFRTELNNLNKEFSALSKQFEEVRGELNAVKVKNFTSSAMIKRS